MNFTAGTDNETKIINCTFSWHRPLNKAFKYSLTKISSSFVENNCREHRDLAKMGEQF